MIKSSTVAVVLTCLLVAGCDSGGGLSATASGDDGGSSPMTEEQVAAALTAGIVLPPGTYTLDEPETDESITASPPPADPGSTDSGTMAQAGDVHPGDVLTIEIHFDAPDANVVGAGIRFGTAGSVRVIPIEGAMGQKSGKLKFQFQVPDGICAMLGNICHEITCSEFAVTSIGTLSRANITQVAMACNDCSEPSCQGLLQECTMSTCFEDGGCAPDTDPPPEDTTCTVDLTRDPVDVIDIPCFDGCDAQWAACGDACDCSEDCTECIVGCDDSQTACTEACLACSSPCGSELDACWLASCGDGSSAESCACNQQCLEDGVACFAGCTTQ